MGNLLALFVRRQSDSETHDEPTEAEPPKMEVEWREIGEAEELKKKRCHRVYAESSDDDDLVLIAWNNKFTAMSTWCSHMGGPLHNGSVIEHKNKMCLQCPFHGYVFDIEDGINPDMGLRQTMFETREKDGKVYILYPKSRLSLESFESEEL